MMMLCPHPTKNYRETTIMTWSFEAFATTKSVSYPTGTWQLPLVSTWSSSAKCSASIDWTFVCWCLQSKAKKQKKLETSSLNTKTTVRLLFGEIMRPNGLISVFNRTLRGSSHGGVPNGTNIDMAYVHGIKMAVATIIELDIRDHQSSMSGWERRSWKSTFDRNKLVSSNGKMPHDDDKPHQKMYTPCFFSCTKCLANDRNCCTDLC